MYMIRRERSAVLGNSLAPRYTASKITRTVASRDWAQLRVLRRKEDETIGFRPTDSTDWLQPLQWHCGTTFLRNVCPCSESPVPNPYRIRIDQFVFARSNSLPLLSPSKLPLSQLRGFVHLWVRSNSHTNRFVNKGYLHIHFDPQ